MTSFESSPYPLVFALTRSETAGADCGILLNTLKWLVFVNVLLIGSLSQAAQDPIVRIASPAGGTLRERPSASAEVIKKLDVGDGVSVIETTTSEGIEWAYAKAQRCVKGNNCANTGPGWIPAEHLAYTARFERVDSWQKRTIQAGVGDYWFTMDIDRDGSARLRYEPCVDCGETGGCPENFTKEGNACVRPGQLFRYRDFVWAKEMNEYFFVNEQDELCSVYSGEDGTFCTTAGDSGQAD